MTVTVTLCFLTSSDSVKERQVKGFAATMQAHAVRVSNLANLKTALEACPPTAPPILIVDQSMTVSLKQLQGLPAVPSIAFVNDSKFTADDLACLAQYSAVCFAGDKYHNPLHSPALRLALLQLKAPKEPLALTNLLHWGHTSVATRQGNIDPKKLPLPAPLGKNAKAFAQFMAAHGHDKAHFVSDGTHWGFTLSAQEAAGLSLVQQIAKLPQELKILSVHSQGGSYELGVFDHWLSLGRKSSEGKKQREFLVINPKHGLARD